MGLPGGTCYTFKKIVAVKGTGLMKRWMVQWEEKYPGEWKDKKYTWEPAINVGKEHWDRFDADYVPVEKGEELVIPVWHKHDKSVVKLVEKRVGKSLSVEWEPYEEKEGKDESKSKENRMAGGKEKRKADDMEVPTQEVSKPKRKEGEVTETKRKRWNARVDSHCCKYVLCGPCYVSLSGEKRRSRMVDQNAVVHQIIDGCSHIDRETFHQAIHACYILDETMDGCCGKCDGWG